MPPHLVRPQGRPAQLILPAPKNLQAPLWRSVSAFRIASLAYAVILLALRRYAYVHWGWAWVVVAGMGVWTVVTSFLYAAPHRRGWPLYISDLIVTVAALLSTDLVQGQHYIHGGLMPVTATWVAAPALAWAVAGGVRAGLICALLTGAAIVLLRHISTADILPSTDLDGPVILLMAAMLAGYISKLAASAEQAIQLATEVEAASRERERIARTIHDSVLQVLAMVQRRGTEIGGAAAEIGRLAGEQEVALRALITADREVSWPEGELDLSAELTRNARAYVSVITPASPVFLNEKAASETSAATREALDNVRKHCGENARAWILVDDEGSEVTVTIRDDGPGFPTARLAEATAEGRLGISHAITGRMRDIGGSAEIISSPGAGTEVRLRVPR